MNKFCNRSLAALVAAASIVTAIPAPAEPWHGDRGEGRGEGHGGRDRGDWHGDGRGEGRGWQRGHEGHGDRRWRYYGGNYGYEGYGGRWRSGERYPYWRSRSYYITDYRDYGLPPPRRGYRYCRTDNGDIVMVAIASGIIGLIVGGALADGHGW